MAKRGEGIDLINDMPPGEYLAGLLCSMAGVSLGEFGDEVGIEEFRATIAGFYIRTTDDEDIYIRCERVGKLISLAGYKTKKEFVCDECGSIMDVKDLSPNFDTEKVCIPCAEEMAEEYE